MIGLIIHAHTHKLHVEVKSRLNGFCLNIGAGPNVIEINATSEQLEEIGRACLNGIRDHAMEEIKHDKE